MSTVGDRFFGSKFLKKLVDKQLSPSHVAWSGAVGMYLAFSPFLGIQTILVFVLAFLFRANGPIVFAVLYTINNPWTMFPIAILDYLVGTWFLRIFSLDFSAYDPAWMAWLNAKLIPYIGPYLGVQKLSLWTYLIGGHLVAIPVACISYPLIKRLYINTMRALERRQQEHENGG